MVTSRQELFAKVLLVFSIVILPFLIIDMINFTVDDVFIPLRYAENLVHGNGLVYNAGEYVEGYSDPIWVLALAGIMTLIPTNTDPLFMFWVTKILSIVFGIGSIVLTYVVVRKYFKDNPKVGLYSSIAVFLMATNANYIAWSVSGLEMTLATFLYLIVALILAGPLIGSVPGIDNNMRNLPGKHHAILVVVLFFSALCRPEAPFFAGFIYSFLLLISQNKLRTILFGVLPYTALMVGFIAVRYSMYSDILPNTFYAKTGTSGGTLLEGLKYVFLSLAGLLGPMFILLPVSLVRRPMRSNPYWLFLGLAVFSGIFATYAGGDWMPGLRLMVPMLPLIIIVCLYNLDAILRKVTIDFPRAFGSLAIVVSVVFIGSGLVTTSRAILRGQSVNLTSGFREIDGGVVSLHYIVAGWIKEHAKPGELLAHGDIGVLGYLNPHIRILDLNGLTDKKIALDIKHRRRFDLEYVFSNKPDIIVLFREPNYARKTVIEHRSQYEAIYQDPRLERLYDLQFTEQMAYVYFRKKESDLK
ncbi:MAG: hypothetical protein HYX66_02410 [Ignavibacteria bacterium]|nr:hypothetical protein [Ignavibacteria bacterium]